MQGDGGKSASANAAGRGHFTGIQEHKMHTGLLFAAHFQLWTACVGVLVLVDQQCWSAPVASTPALFQAWHGGSMGIWQFVTQSRL